MQTSTTDLLFVDSNVLVYVRDKAHPDKHQQAAEWMASLWRSKRGRLSGQVLSEYYVTVTQKLRPGLDAQTARADVRSLLNWQPIALDHRVFEHAWQVQDRYRLSFWDALIFAAAFVGECRYVLTEDLQADQEISGVRIVNPFRTAPSTLEL